MRGVYTSVNDIRKMVFAEVARLAYDYQDGDLSQMEQIPYRIIPGEISTYRESVFLERAIVGERMRLAMGLPFRAASEHAPVSEGALECVRPEKYYQPPLINIIKFACHKCPDNIVHVTDVCQGCLAHPCQEVCPKNAISFADGKSVIDQEKCVKCGKCITACPYSAIIRQERPCAKACGMNAIRSDEYGRADIDQEKCVSCGMCLVNCPFGAISDKAQIFQTIQAIKSDVPVYAAIAPAVEGQFGPGLTPGRIRSAFQALGFTDVIEVAIGADLCTIEEAGDFMKEVPEKLPFMATENILMESVKRGGDRQELHEALRVHSHAAAARVKLEGGQNDLLDRIAADPLFPLSREELEEMLDPRAFIGCCPSQVTRFLKDTVQPVVDRWGAKETLTAKLEV